MHTLHPAEQIAPGAVHFGLLYTGCTTAVVRDSMRPRIRLLITELREAIAGRNQDRRLSRQTNQLPENNNQKREGVERIHGAAIPNFGSLSSPRFPRKRPLRNGDLSGAVSWRRNSRASGHRRLRMDSHWPEVGGASPLAELT
jgi:hypothetical protein